jgi:hypothetical protein
LKALQIAEQNDGWLLTGDCPPTSDEHIDELDRPMHDSFHMAEWDFYASELFGHPGGLLGYSVECMYAFLNELDTSLSTQKAKSKLYGLNFRTKKYMDHSFAMNTVFNALLENPAAYSKELGTYASVKDTLAKYIVN